jgi:hypothetical protein
LRGCNGLNLDDCQENNAFVVHAGNARSKANVSGKEAVNIEVLDLKRQNTILVEQVQKKEDLIVKVTLGNVQSTFGNFQCKFWEHSVNFWELSVQV